MRKKHEKKSCIWITSENSNFIARIRHKIPNKMATISGKASNSDEFKLTP